MKALVLFLALVAGAPAPAAKKHQILFFSASWCGPCYRMKTETIPRVAIPGHTLKYIDTDADPYTANSYGVTELPTYVVLDGDGKPYRRGSGFRGVDQWIRFLNKGD